MPVPPGRKMPPPTLVVAVGGPKKDAPEAKKPMMAEEGAEPAPDADKMRVCLTEIRDYIDSVLKEGSKPSVAPDEEAGEYQERA